MRKTIVICCILALSVCSVSATPSKDSLVGQYIGTIRDINVKAESPKFYWIGTSNGLYCIRKKNGSVSHLTRGNSVLPSDKVTSIAVKADGEVFIGTDKGIVRYDNYAFLPVNKENSALNCNYITALVCMDNKVFAGTREGGITVFEGSNSWSYTMSNAPLASNYVISMEKRKEDELLIVLANDAKIVIRQKQFIVIP